MMNKNTITAVIMAVSMAIVLAICAIGSASARSAYCADLYDAPTGVSASTVTDSETGVQYIVLWSESNGYCGICPRYNADGSLYVVDTEDTGETFPLWGDGQ